MQTRFDSATTTLAVSGEVDMSNADRLQEALATALDRADSGELSVDLSEVAFIDSSGVRVLVLAWRLGAGRDRRVRVVDPQPVVERVLRLTGVGHLLGLPVPAPDEPDAGWLL